MKIVSYQYNATKDCTASAVDALDKKQNFIFSYNLFFICLLFSFFFLTKISFADLVSDPSQEGPNRIRACQITGGQVATESLAMIDQNLFSSAKDVTLDFSNPVCIADVLSAYTAFKVSLAFANKACQGKANVRVLPSLMSDIKDLIVDATKISTKGVECGGPLGGTIATFAGLTGVLATKYGIAEEVYRSAHVCGHTWTKSNNVQYDRSTPNYKKKVEDIVNGYSATDKSKMNLGNRSYREWYYGGIEYEDNTGNDDVCYDVTDGSLCGSSSSEACDVFPRQKYYMRGFQQPNFNCKKYDIYAGQNDPLTKETISPTRLTKIRAAYDCCMSRSKDFICIQYLPFQDLHKLGNKDELGITDDTTQIDAAEINFAPILTKDDYKFCRAGQNCDIRGISFSTEYEQSSNKGIICASTYSLCPFNFNLDGGSTICDYAKDGVRRDDGSWDMIDPIDIEQKECAGKSDLRDADCKIISTKAGKCLNYCQYMNHCVKTNTSNFHYATTIDSPYSSNACLNFIGDSRNMTSIDGDLIYGSQRHFTAPIAQCVKETIENVFYNRAGHTKCANVNEIPGADGTCYSGEYIYVQGEIAPLDKKSFFASLQNNLRTVIKLLLMMSIMFYGVKVLLAMKEIDKKELLMYVIKIGLIMYFALGTAWQTFFFDGVYNASAVISNIVYKIQVPDDETKQDGCQFGSVTKTMSGELITSVSSQTSATDYPKGKSYLAIWDTLDCKLARYLGFGPEASVSNLVLLIVAAFYTGSIGVYFTVMTLIFGLFFVMICIRALHIFLSSAISIIIMIYVSPIVIALTLFAKTAGIFKSWMSNLMSFILQPIILFAYIAIMISILDKVLIGSASFDGNPPNRRINCSEICKSGSSIIVKTAENSTNFCTEEGDVIIDPMKDSIACILTSHSFSKRPGLEIVGITINILSTFDEGFVDRVITMMKGALVMYLLLSILDDIPAIATALLGGAALPSSKVSLKQLTKDTRGFLVGIQKRGARALKKHAKKPDLSGAARALGEKGKKPSTKGEDNRLDIVKEENNEKSDKSE